MGCAREGERTQGICAPTRPAGVKHRREIRRLHIPQGQTPSLPRASFLDSSLPSSSPLICDPDLRLLPSSGPPSSLLIDSRRLPLLFVRSQDRYVSITSSPFGFPPLGCALPLLLIWMCTASARLGCALQFTSPLQLCFPPLPLFLSMSFLCLWLCYTDADWKCSSSLFLQLIAQWQVHLPSSAIMIPGLI